jgi:STE24 endopeptidase
MEDKAGKYARIRYRLALIDIVYTLLLLILLQTSGLAPCLKRSVFILSDNQFIAAALYALIIFLLYSALNFPLDFYRSFVVEHEFRLSNQRFHLWFLDYIKAAALSLAVFIILIETFFFFIIKYPSSWWWMSAVFWIFLTVVVARIFPVLVVPLFYKYKRIENDELRSRIMELAKRMRVSVLDVFEINFSRKSLKANAAFVGIGRTKRVLLTDTLLGANFLPDEIGLILAHEFAHYRFRHLMKMVAVNSCVILLSFYIFFQLNKAGLDIKDIASLGTWIFLFMLFQICLAPFLNMISRAMEKNADLEAIRVSGRKDSFISMISKLGEQNLAERKPPLWAKILFYDHPPIGERIAYAKNPAI